MRINQNFTMLCILLGLLPVTVQVSAQQAPQSGLKLNGMFNNNMVLQQQTDAPIWGVAEPKANVAVATTWSKQVARTKADKDGKWSTTLKTPAAGGPFEIQIRSGNQTKVLKNVMAGEVWICSGQSNMQWKMKGFGVDHFKDDVQKAKHPNIRFCQVAQTMSLQAEDDLKTQWSVCNPNTTLNFSATAYFFADKLRQELGDIPIGLVSTNWGGSSAEAWTSTDTLNQHFPEFSEHYTKIPEYTKKAGDVKFGRSSKNKPKGLNHRSPSVLYNQMIHPLIPFAIRGVIWYQGESNVKEPVQYRKLFPAMIKSWREEWNQGDFPFYFVQIAPFEYKREKLPVALLREAQTYALELPNTGMVVTMDIGDPTNIHPQQKKPVGERLALQALANDYGKSNLVCSGPTFTESKTEKKKQIRLSFKNIGGGLASRDGEPLTHFTIAGKDKVFHPAVAEIDGDSIIVSSEKVKRPEAVRFGWGNADEPNLMNKEGLPCSSFRTDSWPTPGEVSSTTATAPVKQAYVSTADDKELPNVVFIISDELAYYELSHMGNKKLRTPNIDQMAKEGIRFTRALASAPVCGPLRCCLMTGKHMGHSSMRNNRGGTPIRADEYTMANMFKDRGYATGGFGKWGIGGRGSTGVPEKHGFDVFFGYYDQVHAHSYFPAHLVRNSEEVILPGNKGGHSGETYSHHEIMKEGLQFIRDNKEKPFFCYLPFTPPHGSFDIPAAEQGFQRYSNDAWMKDPAVSQKAKNYAAMVSMLDNDVQRVLDLLTELNLEDNTMVIFSGDNGGENRFADKEHPNGYFGPNVNPETGLVFRGQKRTLYEGALRIPFLVRWPGKIKPAQTTDHLTYQVDLMPTFAEMIGAKPPVEMDGLSILPTILGEEAVGRPQQQHEYMYWEYLNQIAARKGDWKAVKPGPKKPWELYDLSTDAGEQNNVAESNSELLNELIAYAEKSHVPAKPGKFLRNDLQKRDREAKHKKPAPLVPAQ